ncbi:MAG: bifunctional phosphoglucose/phosphomannose isomerase [Candidatus Bathyarchaeota archaeon]|nr:MAG: bifunctional phosphoglucose/phosphomannose isomerase [Candidatus Bathyarchaeota archaeon]
MDTILDEPERLRVLDKSGMLEVLGRFPEDCRSAIEVAEKTPLGDLPNRSYKAVVFAGVGGSAIGGQLVADWLRDESPIPLVISRRYHLPGFVDCNTLVFAVSYSGNTEETLDMLREAIVKESPIVSVTSGGKLEKLSTKKGLPLILMPGELIPRVALPYQFFILAVVLNRLGLVPRSWGEVDEAIGVIEGLREELKLEVPTEANPAKKIALKMRSKVPLVYGPSLLEGAAYRFGTQLNENSKVPSASGAFPELFHNAVLGSEGPDEVLRPLFVLIIRDPGESERVKRKIDRFKSLLEGRVGGLLEVEAKGKGKLARMLSIIYMGDYISNYLGLLYGRDPSSMRSIEKIKRV